MKGFTSLFAFSEYFKDDTVCEEYFTNLRFSNREFCVLCGHNKIYHCKSSTSKKLYKCPKCNKKFNIFVNTFFENTKISIKKWFVAIYLFNSSSKGISSVQLAKQLGTTQKTAWFMLHRIRNSFGDDDFQFNTPIEVDETYVGGNEKNKHKSKKTKGAQGRSLKTKMAVLGIINRDENKKVRAFHVKDVTGKTIQNYIRKNVEKGTQIYTDEYRGYSILKPEYPRSFIRHGQKQFVKNEIHTNNIENFWGIFKRGYFGIYHWMSEKHLQKYLDEYTHRFNYKYNWQVGFNTLLIKAKRLKYQGLING